MHEQLTVPFPEADNAAPDLIVIEGLLADSNEARKAMVGAVDSGELPIDEWYTACDAERLGPLDQRRVALSWAVNWLAMGGTIERNGVVLDGSKIFGEKANFDG